jgi:ribosomal protein S18 acetylase RimI-like enzyme
VYSTKSLDRIYAQKNAERLALIASEIPGVTWTPDMVTAEEIPGDSGKIPLLSKWQHSVALEDAGVPVAVAIGYECRDKDGVKQALHLGALACDRAYKGRKLGERLLVSFLKVALERGYVALDEPNVTFSLQTGAAPENAPLRHLYEKYGFKVDHELEKDNGTKNVVMIAYQGDVTQALARASLA